MYVCMYVCTKTECILLFQTGFLSVIHDTYIATVNCNERTEHREVATSLENQGDRRSLYIITADTKEGEGRC